MTEPGKTPPTDRAPEPARVPTERPATTTVLNKRERTSVGVSDTIEPPPPPPPKSEDG